MRRSTMLALCALVPMALQAQQPDTVRRRSGLPRDVMREAVAQYNEPAALRNEGATEIAAGRDIQGNVAVLSGPLTIAGHVTGRVVALNSDVILKPSAHIDGDVLVVVGNVEGRDAAYIGGELRIYRERLAYTVQDGALQVANAGSGEDVPWWRRWEGRRQASGSKIQVASAGAYNRVEGLPINLGPQMYRDFSGGSARLDAYAVVRTASSFRADDNDIGHNLHGEARFGRASGWLVGARLFDIVDPTESWQLSNLEAGLSSALFRRDYRDYYERHGGSVEAGVFAGRNATFTVSYGDEHWLPRVARPAWTLFRSDVAWRDNPVADAAHLHLVQAGLTVDTRSDVDNPWTGWYLRAELERGAGHIDSLGLLSVPRTHAGDGRLTYDRGFLDVRRYNRLSPGRQLNLRVVAGGWLGGDPLPVERRFSVDGPGALPGFEFRSMRAGDDVATCTPAVAAPGYPAQCDRMLLAQAEYRASLHWGLFDWGNDNGWHPGHLHGDAAWVLFADAGRGWLVGDETQPMTYGRGVIPSLSSFRTDMGVGLDFDEIGVYLAKALSTPGQPARAFVRLRHRF
ncbi:MAG TPA: BamA/TamA family outer membrane protein [Gemmatimonadaceae bacterium]|nr:BamA/TamA family outer membrane protein [Gemmatimonadaceae bacterium]